MPTVPAAWLTFAEGSVYHAYDQPVRVWGISVTDDQQLAGAIMKVGGSIFLWSIVVTLWFTRFAASYASEHDYQPGRADAVGRDHRPRRRPADLRRGRAAVRQGAGGGRTERPAAA